MPITQMNYMRGSIVNGYVVKEDTRIEDGKLIYGDPDVMKHMGHSYETIDAEEIKSILKASGIVVKGDVVAKKFVGTQYRGTKPAKVFNDGCNSISISSGCIMIDGEKYDKSDYPIIVVNGNCDYVEGSVGDVYVTGDINECKTASGNVDCRAVFGDAKTMSGNITAGFVRGDAKTMSGNIASRDERFFFEKLQEVLEKLVDDDLRRKINGMLHDKLY